MSDIREGLRRGSFYAKGFMNMIIPGRILSSLLDTEFKKLDASQKHEIEERAEYYVKLPKNASVSFSGSTKISDFRFPWRKQDRHSAYFLDLFPYLHILPHHLRFNYFAGDTDVEAKCPTFIKSRPIVNGSSYSALCRLNSLRHYRFVNDNIPFESKANKVVSRNEVRLQSWRTRLLEMYADNVMMDFGQINTDCGRPEWVKPFMSIHDQLKHKFVMCIRGHDVATNLKWVMSSNSLAVMPRPSVESWFQEGLLMPDIHYVEIKDDYSDLPERVEWFITHPKEARDIIHNANQWTMRFRNIHVERCAMAVAVRRYFEQTGQLIL